MADPLRMIDVDLAFVRRDTATIARYLRETEVVDPFVTARLAMLLDPFGTTENCLRFVQRPSSSVKTSRPEVRRIVVEAMLSTATKDSANRHCGRASKEEAQAAVGARLGVDARTIRNIVAQPRPTRKTRISKKAKSAI